MSKANKWLAVLCASASAISTVSAYNLFFSSNTADQNRHETAKQEPPNKPCELENANVDDIISDSFRPERPPSVRPDDPPPPPPPGGGGGISLPPIEENIYIYLEKSQKLQIEDIIDNKTEQDDSNKKVTIPDVSIPNLKINNNILEQQSKDFVSCMNERFAIYGKKARKDYTKSVASRLEFVNNSKKNLSSQSIKGFSQQFNSLIPDSETRDFVTMIGGTSFQKGSVDNDAITNIISKHCQEKSNNQKIREISEQFNALSKDLTQNNTYDTINISILKKQKLKENDFATSKSNEEKSNTQRVKELKNQLSGSAKTSTKGYGHHQKNACKSTGDSDSLSTDGKALNYNNYSFDDDSSSSNSVLNVKTDDLNIDNI